MSIGGVNMIWNPNILWSIIGIIGGAIVSILFHFYGVIRKSLTYDITTTTIVSNNFSQIKGLSIKYNKSKIKNLNTSTITIKNNGNSIILPEDISLHLPLTLTTDGEFFVNSVEILSKNKINNMRLVYDLEENISKSVSIQFDYLAKNDIVSFSVFHTGNVSLSGVLKNGKIKKARELKENILLHLNLSFILGIIFQILINIFSNYLSSFIVK